MSHGQPYTEILKSLVRGIVACPDHVVIHGEQIPRSYWVTIQVHKSDHGKVVGREGQTIGSLQVVGEAMAKRRGDKFRITMEHPAAGDNSRKGLPYVPDEQWTRDDEVTELVTTVLTECCDKFKLNVRSFGDSTVVVIGSKEIDLKLELALRTLFRAWGKAQGRHIDLECGQIGG